MGFQIFTSDTVGNGVQADLLETDDMYVEEGVTVGREDAAAVIDFTVSGIGSNHTVEIDGRVMGGGTAISLGDDISGLDRFNTVIVGSTGYVRSVHGSGVAILMTGTDATVKNAGKLVATIGIELTRGQHIPGGFAVIENTGTIESPFGIMHTNSAETLKVFNRGTIDAGTNAIFWSTGSAIDELYNTGQMRGYVRLGGGDDLYDGRGGMFSGQIHGEDGNDVLIGGDCNEVFIGGNGDDEMRGGRGNDEYSISPGDTAFERAGQGTDTVFAYSSYTLGANIENLGLGIKAVAGTGNGLHNVITGNGAIANVLTGLAGNDTLSGGDGSDRLVGGAGKDMLTGGNHADRFTFNDIAESRAAGGIDRIMDFSRAEGDKIQLNLIDADTTKAGNQAFKFVGMAAFSGKAGELRYQKIGSDSHIQADVNGDGKADFTVISDLATNFVKGDFIL